VPLRELRVAARFGLETELAGESRKSAEAPTARMFSHRPCGALIERCSWPAMSWKEMRCRI